MEKITFVLELRHRLFLLLFSHQAFFMLEDRTLALPSPPLSVSLLCSLSIIFFAQHLTYVMIITTKGKNKNIQNCFSVCHFLSFVSHAHWSIHSDTRVILCLLFCLFIHIFRKSAPNMLFSLSVSFSSRVF